VGDTTGGLGGPLLTSGVLSSHRPHQQQFRRRCPARPGRSPGRWGRDQRSHLTSSPCRSGCR